MVSRAAWVAVEACLVALLACTASAPGEMSMTDAGRVAPVETDVDKLSKLVRLPVRPKAAQWRRATLGSGGPLGPTDWTLVALLDFEPEDADAIVSVARQRPTPAAVTIGDRSWLPPEVSAALEKASRLDASAFHRSPLMHGVLLHLDGSSRFVLILYTL